ncbi:11426_t:CDS:2 [Diversispora eburnea]|uniref:11426_t:CDS:1 n=1 Tax=Diversispora eburnea TaxID=1213867 RepID=A0A9N9AAB7_9GLOM|nr:11426_t:CDS:2 [Diversispora eburnea]
MKVAPMTRATTSKRGRDPRGGTPKPLDPPIDLVWKPDLEKIMNVRRTSRTVQSTRLPLLSDADLGMPYDLSVVSNAFYGDDSVLCPRRFSGLDSKDVALLVPAKPAINVIPGLAQLRRHSNDPKTWLRRTQYISASESAYRNENAAMTMESRMATLKASNEFLHRTHEEQIAAIEHSFEAANDPKRLKQLKHAKDPNIKPVEIIPVFPDFEVRNALLAHLILDGDPWGGISLEDDDDHGEMIQDRAAKAIKRPMASGNERFLMLYAPTKESTERLQNKRRFEDLDGEVFTFKWVRDYNIENQYYPKNSELLFYEKYVDDDVNKEKHMLYSPFSVRTILKRRRQTVAPIDDKEFLEVCRSDRLHEHEIESLMSKRKKTKNAQESIQEDIIQEDIIQEDTIQEDTFQEDTFQEDTFQEDTFFNEKNHFEI